MQDCTERRRKKGKTLKRVVKQLTPFGATHTRRHDTSPLTVHRECARAVHRTLPVTVSQAGKNSFWTQVHADTHTLSQSSANTRCIVCAGACCWWSDPSVQPLCLCLNADVTEGSVGGRVRVRKSVRLWSGRGLYVSHWGGSSVLGLHHKDYCNTVQMGPCCNRLGRVDWTTGGGGGGLQRSGDGWHFFIWWQTTNPEPAQRN